MCTVIVGVTVVLSAVWLALTVKRYHAEREVESYAR